VDILSGKPTIKGTRLSVEFILNLLAHGSTIDDIMREYQGLEKEDIQAGLLFATKSMHRTRRVGMVKIFELRRNIYFRCRTRDF
jgi:uncharacterized protein (DUF433 family)